MEMAMLWNALLTIALGLVGWNWVTMSKELQRVTILLNRTREEIAKDYATKAELGSGVNRVMDRLEAIDDKLDRALK